MQAFDDYIAEHGADAVRKSPENRQYMRARFACPRQAGNYILDFSNSLLLAIASNRTLLFKYDATKSRGYTDWMANNENSEEYCRKGLDFAEWMPRLAEVFPNESDWVNLTVELPGKPPATPVGDAVILQNTRTWGLSLFPGEFNGLMNLEDDEASDHFTESMGLLKPIKDDDRVHKLYSEGHHFLYGMLFHRSFSFTKDLIESVQPDIPSWTNDSDVFSIGLHSRHVGEEDDGSDVTELVDCVQKLQRMPEATSKRCLVYAMSDRAATVANLANHAGHNCTVASVTREADVKAVKSGPQEHGPFAGVAFFQDVALVMHAKSALVGRLRSSTSFLLSSMEYRRKLEAWEKGLENPHNFGRCRSS